MQVFSGEISACCGRLLFSKLVHAASKACALQADNFMSTFIVQGPFTYEALPPSDIRFVPLKQTREFNAAELLQVSRSAAPCRLPDCRPR